MASSQPPTARSVAILVVLIAVAAIWFFSSHHGPSSAWSAKATNYVVLNPADLGVTVQVTNTGKAAGMPDCQISAQDPDYAYHGFDDVTLKDPVQPGQTTHFADSFVITGQGAQYVTEVQVKCS
jgi:hypothetical protein